MSMIISFSEVKGKHEHRSGIDESLAYKRVGDIDYSSLPYMPTMVVPDYMDEYVAYRMLVERFVGWMQTEIFGVEGRVFCKVTELKKGYLSAFVPATYTLEDEGAMWKGDRILLDKRLAELNPYLAVEPILNAMAHYTAYMEGRPYRNGDVEFEKYLRDNCLPSALDGRFDMMNSIKIYDKFMYDEL